MCTWLPAAGSFNPPAIISSCEIENTLVGDGCQLRFSKLTNTVLGRNTFVDVGCDISDSVLLGNRCYQHSSVILSIVLTCYENPRINCRQWHLAASGGTAGQRHGWHDTR